ncbi:MAG: hypothetical protein II304_03865 [Bacteroidales bacterium]|jgi:hypothetical protein|nr:hypothetical protein [Bacteroidales bacterium]
MKTGKIVVGYQGVGKSTLSYHNKNVIDLESSNFFVNGKRADDWYIPYCNIARTLCRQGYIVCISSHEVVRKELLNNPAPNQIIVCPSLDLKDKWINNLRNRYNQNKSDKNYKALRNAEACYDENISALTNQQGFEHIIIDNMGYDLSSLLELS